MKVFSRMPWNSVAGIGYSHSEIVPFAITFSHYHHTVTVTKNFSTANENRRIVRRGFWLKTCAFFFGWFWSQDNAIMQVLKFTLLNVSLMFPKERGTENALLFNKAFTYLCMICWDEFWPESNLNSSRQALTTHHMAKISYFLNSFSILPLSLQAAVTYSSLLFL